MWSDSARGEHTPPSGGDGPSRRRPVSRAGLVLLILAVGSVILGSIALVAAWLRRLGGSP